MSDSYFGTWLNLSDPHEDEGTEWEQAWEAVEEAEEPLWCPACSDSFAGCEVCCMRPRRAPEMPVEVTG